MSISTRALGSRAFEGLIGSALGGATGAVAGAAAYSPDTPKEWLDEYGMVRSRSLTREEKKNRILSAVAGGMGGALLGSGISLGASGVLRSGVTGRERAAAKEVAEEYLTPLRQLVEDWEGMYARTPNPGSAHAKQLAKRVEAGRIVAQEEEKRVTQDLVDLAARRRADMPFGGPETLFPGGRAGKGAYTGSTHRGVAKEHFDAIAHRQAPGGPEAMNFENAYDAFTNAVGERMTKMSSAYMLRELKLISEAPLG